MDAKRVGLLDHVEELRQRCIWVLLFWLGCSCVAYAFADKVYQLLTTPYGGTLVYLSPQEAFLTQMKIALFLGFVFALPFILLQIWKFIAPALGKRERRWLYMYCPIVFALFLGGVFFAYFFVLPQALRFLLSFGGVVLEPMLRVGDYITFVLSLLASFGVVFELPILLIALSSLGLVSYTSLVRNRKTAIVLILLLAALITPPDGLTLLIMAVPLIVLYEVSIWIVYFLHK